MVLARSAVFVLYPHANFDSDQAVIGLMAKHLSEGRAWPLFFYGQQYLLGTEAWLAVPWFWAFGASVSSLKLSLLLSNLVVGAGLVTGLIRGGLRPLNAVCAASVFALAPPTAAYRLMEAMGGNVEPFVFVVVAWALRSRPLACGVVLALGFLTREFVVYAAVALVAREFLTRRGQSRDAWMRVAIAAVAFFAAVELVHALVPLSDVAGPGTRPAAYHQLDTEAGAGLGARVALAPSELPTRLASFLGALGPQPAGTLIALAVAVAFVRVGMLAFSERGSATSGVGVPPMAWFLMAVGLLALGAFIATRPPDNAPLRYVLLALMLPVGLIAAWLSLEPRRAVRVALLFAVAVWGGLSAWNHLDYGRQFVRGQADPVAVLGAALEARGIAVVWAPYWRAYKLSFLTGERVIAASTDVVRIREYQQRAAAGGASVPLVRDEPCPGGETLAGWYLCPSPSRD